MDKSTTTGLRSNVTRIILTAAVGLFVWTSGAAAQETLADLVQQTDCNWIIGKWAGESDSGQKYEKEYRWELKNHLISIHFKGFSIEYHAIIFYKADEQEVVQVGVDSNGGNGKGTWMAENGKAIWRNEHTNENGEISRMAFVYTKVDAQTMKEAIYTVDEYGQLSEEPQATLEYKRPPKKAGDKVSRTR